MLVTSGTLGTSSNFQSYTLEISKKDDFECNFLPHWLGQCALLAPVVSVRPQNL